MSFNLALLYRPCIINILEYKVLKKVLSKRSWSWSCVKGLGLGLGLEPKVLGLGLGLEEKVLVLVLKKRSW